MQPYLKSSGAAGKRSQQFIHLQCGGSELAVGLDQRVGAATLLAIGQLPGKDGLEALRRHAGPRENTLALHIGRRRDDNHRVAALLGGLGGGLAAPAGAIYPGMDVEVIAESFIVVVVGGMGSLPGTLLGALIIGQLNAFGILFFPRFALLFVYVLMVVVLVTRPWGLLGKPLAR